MVAGMERCLLKTVVLVNCWLIPELSGNYAGENANILIRGKRIEAIIPTGWEASESANECYDCKGMTLLPGLHNIHTHLNYGYYNGVIRLNDFKLMLRSSRRFLDYGITTIRDMGSPKRVSTYVRNAINSGLFPEQRYIAPGKGTAVSSDDAVSFPSTALPTRLSSTTVRRPPVCGAIWRAGRFPDSAVSRKRSTKEIFLRRICYD